MHLYIQESGKEKKQDILKTDPFSNDAKLVLWIPIPILHFTGRELFELPRGETAWLLFISVIMNASKSFHLHVFQDNISIPLYFLHQLFA